MSLAELQTRCDLRHLRDACTAGLLGYLPASAKPSSCDILLEDEPPKSGITLGILSGLLFLHQRGLVHTDVHEGNILVMNFEVRKGALLLKLIDFGGLSAKGQRCRVVCKARKHPKFEADFEQLARPELDWHALGMACLEGTSMHPEWLYELQWCTAKEMDHIAAEMFRYNFLGHLNPYEGFPMFFELLQKTVLQHDPDFFLEAINSNSWDFWAGFLSLGLRHVSKELQNNKEIVLAAVQRTGLALEFASQELRSVPEIVLEALRKDPTAVRFVAPELLSNRDFMFAALRQPAQHGEALMYAADPLKSDRELVLAAVQQDGTALAHAADVLKSDWEVVFEAVLQNSAAVEYASHTLRSDHGLRPLAEVLRSCSNHFSGFKWAPQISLLQDSVACLETNTMARADEMANRWSALSPGALRDVASSVSEKAASLLRMAVDLQKTAVAVERMESEEGSVPSGRWISCWSGLLMQIADNSLRKCDEHVHANSLTKIRKIREKLHKHLDFLARVAHEPLTGHGIRETVRAFFSSRLRRVEAHVGLRRETFTFSVFENMKKTELAEELAKKEDSCGIHREAGNISVFVLDNLQEVLKESNAEESYRLVFEQDFFIRGV